MDSEILKHNIYRLEYTMFKNKDFISFLCLPKSFPKEDTQLSSTTELYTINDEDMRTCERDVGDL